mgnify:CR=1 FL=1
MALIPITEAAKLGLLPREFEEFFPGIARSSLFGSPLTLNLRQFRPGAGPLERGVGRFGFQHGVPGIAGVRFGLGPLLQGLGLSPGPSAVTAPGVVPGGRAQAGRGGVASAETLAARGQPQDIEAIRRLLESGQLDPRSLPPGLVAALMGGAAPRPVSTVHGPVATAPRPAPAAGIAEPLGQARQALTGASAAEQLVQAVQGIPPGSFAMTPEARVAFEAQRRGERDPVTEGGVEAGALPSFAAENIARLAQGALPFTDTFTDPRFPGVEFPTTGPVSGLPGTPKAAIPTDVTAGVEAGVVPPPSPAPSVLAGLSWQDVLGALGVAVGAAGGGQQLAQGQIPQGLLTLGRTGLTAAQMTGLVGRVPGPGVLDVVKGAVQGIPGAVAGTGTSLAANEAARQALLSGTETAAGSLAGAVPLLNIATLGVGLGLGPKGELAPREGESFGSAFPRAYASPEAQVAGLAGGPILSAIVAAAKAGGLFGAHRSLRAKQTAELLEAGRIGDTLRGPIGSYDQAAILEDFFKVGGHVGYIQQPAEFVRRALTDPGSIMEASSPGGSWGQPSAMGVRTGLLGSSIQATVQSAVKHGRRLAAQQ